MVTRSTFGWLQVNCALFPQGGGQHPYLPWSGLAKVLGNWRACGQFERCFLVLKPPGLRLRFYGEHLGERLEPELLAWLLEAEAQNELRGFRFTVYEPEYFRFGGPAGMAIAHDYFDNDTRMVLSYETLSVDAKRNLPRHLLSVSVSSHLFERCLDDGGELWDVWQRLARALSGVPPGPHPVDELDLLRAASTAASAFTASLAPPAADLLHRAFASNDSVATRLRAVADGGRLTVGVRAWLAAACVFHWNRLGLTAPELQPVVGRVLQLLHPDEDRS